jgi:hypothetical protein
MPTLRELSLQEFEVVPAEALPVLAPADRWVVLVRRDQLVSAVAPGGTLAAGTRPAGILVAAAGLDQAGAFQSEAFRELPEAAALVLTGPAGDGTEPERSGPPPVVGVVDGAVLARAVLRGPGRGGGETVTAGPAPVIVRPCDYFQDRELCATPMSFAGRPPVMPRCRNDRQLAAHFYGWEAAPERR